MFKINIKRKYIMVLSVFTSVFFIISFFGFFNEYNLRKQYENALAASMADAVNEADIGDTLVSLNESISQKRLYYGSNRYRPNSFQWRYYTAAMAFQKINSTYMLIYSKNEKMASKGINNIAEILSSYSNYFKSIYITMPIITEANGEEYIIIEDKDIEKLKIIEQTTRDISEIIDEVYSDISLNQNHMWKIAIQRISEYEPISNMQ